jgi:hypothetical protein
MYFFVFMAWKINLVVSASMLCWSWLIIVGFCSSISIAISPSCSYSYTTFSSSMLVSLKVSTKYFQLSCTSISRTNNTFNYTSKCLSNHSSANGYFYSRSRVRIPLNSIPLIIYWIRKPIIFRQLLGLYDNITKRLIGNSLNALSF